MNQDAKDELRQWLRFIWNETRNLPSSVAVERLVRTLQQLDTSSILGCPLSQQWTTRAACLELVKYIKDELVATEEILAPLIIALVSRQGLVQDTPQETGHVGVDRRIQIAQALHNGATTSGGSQGDPGGMGERVA